MRRQHFEGSWCHFLHNLISKPKDDVSFVFELGEEFILNPAVEVLTELTNVSRPLTTDFVVDQPAADVISEGPTQSASGLKIALANMYGERY